jgi:hypothetical protein
MGANDVLCGESGLFEPETVVIQCNDRTIKGILEWPPWEAREEFSRENPDSPPSSFRIRHFQSSVVEEVPADLVKAVFFVRDFDGSAEHTELQFHTHAPVVPGIWMRVKFRDGEVIEGVVHNSIRYLIEPGFFLRSIDPGSNNRLIYVMKSCLVDHHILGLTKI